ncbi:MAG: TylF/MycF/NovP-related O-methyltransferase, partial [Candidatus Xenobia bacterium]
MVKPENLYLDLLEKCLVNQLYQDPAIDWQGRSGQAVAFNPLMRLLGRDWPLQAPTMIGLMRLRNIRKLVDTVLDEEVPGHLLEAGAWRGGSSIYMRGILAARGVTNRRVFVADSFEGQPLPMAPADAGDQTHSFPELCVSEEQVRANFARYDLLDEQVVFVPGWFRESLPAAPVARIALLKLDAAMYGGTMDALQALYDRVSPGGYVAIDGYGSSPAVRAAVDEFRAQRGIDAGLSNVDGWGFYWRKPVTAAAEPVKIQPVADAEGAPRPTFSVIIPVYNRLDFLPECLESVLSRDLGPEELEIIIADDHSDEEKSARIRELAGTRARYMRSPHNLGLYQNCNQALRCTRGR